MCVCVYVYRCSSSSHSVTGRSLVSDSSSRWSVSVMSRKSRMAGAVCCVEPHLTNMEEAHHYGSFRIHSRRFSSSCCCYHYYYHYRYYYYYCASMPAGMTRPRNHPCRFETSFTRAPLPHHRHRLLLHHHLDRTRQQYRMLCAFCSQTPLSWSRQGHHTRARGMSCHCHDNLADPIAPTFHRRLSDSLIPISHLGGRGETVRKRTGGRERHGVQR
ncbi:uncharacterized protein K489DRAFT_63557 [Dissoconium aciculare CBS 342.82]|uniref:Uncharacterized protein n=1 Tax=Dissoconium aciculare CBS 342.82 TaxID=1314786 RepID=A0A6J3LWF7_9PEZI|nr:uncharacterized protein K489DRAFT_63557 [Dissoconium aciculare CBS 342.82]KAF1819988.1 hypothetical protein K489DRAFT_63557 [Dissoconium aciculare CBS 342.82]